MESFTPQQERQWRSYRLGQLATQLVECDDDQKAKRLAREIPKVAAELLALALQERAERRAAEPGATDQ